MIIDIALLIVLCFAIYKGYTKGLVISVFATLAWALGVIVALHFLANVTSFLQKMFHSQSVYLSILSFILIFVVIVVVIYFVGHLLEKVIDIAQLGLVNKICGAVLICAVYVFLFSTALCLFNHAGFITPEMKLQSKSYNLVEPISEEGIKGLGHVFPTLKDSYDKVEQLLDNESSKIVKH